MIFGNRQSVPREDQWGGELDGFMGGAGAEEGVVGKGERLGIAAGGQGERGFFFVQFGLFESDSLVEAIDAGGLEAGFFELVDGVGLGFFQAFAAGVAAFQGIIGEKFYVGPPGLTVEIGSGVLLRESGARKR